MTASPGWSEYIGRPWVNGEYDCWALIRDVYRDRLRIELPEIAVDSDNLKEVMAAFGNPDNLLPWAPIRQPEHLCLVFFSPGEHRAAHCGLWLEILGGRYLHCHRRSGVVCEDRITLEQNGWCNPQYYRHAGCVKKCPV